MNDLFRKATRAVTESFVDAVCTATLLKDKIEAQVFGADYAEWRQRQRVREHNYAQGLRVAQRYLRERHPEVCLLSAQSADFHVRAAKWFAERVEAEGGVSWPTQARAARKVEAEIFAPRATHETIDHDHIASLIRMQQAVAKELKRSGRDRNHDPS